MADYLPVTDAEFNTWISAFTTYIGVNAVKIGLQTTDSTALEAVNTVFYNAYAAHQSAQTSARVARQAKDDARVAVESAVRSLVRRIQAFPGTTDSQRQALGITVRDGTLSPASAAAVATRPWATVNTSQHLRHTIDFRDAANKNHRAKPDGVTGCEIWVKIGTAPTDPPADMRFLALDTATPYVMDYSLADAGKMAYYMLRWVNSKSEKGPWSETVEATIVG